MDPSSGTNQEMGAHSLESMLISPKPQQDQRKPRPQPEEALHCPRCESTNTKFCYYNNYSLSQPRYFCKSCRRYWTKGGTLRNVPVGGGCRKNRRSSSSSASRRAQDQGGPISTLISNNDYDTPNPFTTLHSLTYDQSSDHMSLPFLGLHKFPYQLGPHELSHDILSYANRSKNGHGDMNGGFLDSLKNEFGLLENTQNNVHDSRHRQNLYYGYGSDGMNNNMGDPVDSGGAPSSCDHEMMSPAGSANEALGATSMKQELLCSDRDGENRVLWGCPWQMNGDQYRGNGVMGDVNSGRGSWNGLGSSWYGLLNSPLM
ncbi:hypothetical protein ACJRO7_011819 [Eucalyptus globulus]|uniref:Dof zinc finger protein n=2 Tax=Eucalyptus globulus TaxID=34317 RepID=A0ABD3LKZ5_EUCGL